MLRLGASPAAASPHGFRIGRTRWVVERAFAWLHAFLGSVVIEVLEQGAGRPVGRACRRCGTVSPTGDI